MLSSAKLLEWLNAEDKFRNLLRDLEASGGAAVAALLRRAAEAAVRPPDCAEAPPRRNFVHADMCRDACWEKLHTGNWAEVSMVWRDAYTAASLLCACAQPQPAGSTAARATANEGAASVSASAPAAPAASAARASSAAAPVSGAAVPSQQPAAPPAGSQPTAGAHGAMASAERLPPDAAEATEAAETAETLWQLDMAALLGGPLFRSALDACIAVLQDRSVAAARAAVAAKAQATSASGPGTGGPASKRQRLPDGGFRGPGSGRGPPDGQSGVDQEQPAGGAGSRVRLLGGTPAQEVSLPPGAMQSAMIQRGPLMSLERFYQECMSAPDGGRPHVFTGGIEHWPARQRWTDPAYLRAAAGARTVPIEVGKDYLAAGWGQRLMTLSEFMDRHILPASCGDGGSGMGTGDSASDPGLARGYLAQHELFDQIPALKADICEPEYCAFGSGGRTAVNAWFGPPGTVTPLHTDPYHNLLAQVVGRKHVRLHHPDLTPGLFPFTEGFTTNCSQVDVDAPDAARFPGYAALEHWDCVMEPGDMLYIPPRWWHFVKSLSVSFSVSFWWS